MKCPCTILELHTALYWQPLHLAAPHQLVAQQQRQRTSLHAQCSTCHCRALWFYGTCHVPGPIAAPFAAKSMLKASLEPYLQPKPLQWPRCRSAQPLLRAGLGLLPASKRALLLQDGEAREDSERLRLSSAGLRGDEQPLPPRMVSFIVDALQDRWGPRLAMLTHGCVG